MKYMVHYVTKRVLSVILPELCRVFCDSTEINKYKTVVATNIVTKSDV